MDIILWVAGVIFAIPCIIWTIIIYFERTRKTFFRWKKPFLTTLFGISWTIFIILIIVAFVCY
ncbi:hypothetical protein [Spiroplasma endosymbiont of Crioceris asparagi]|uniref:hypothetical protein n=1 Tax=Spiroplasma endosymbiont of Crioceris asparagi TaxID=3066286 RepID=UPI0030CB2A36